MKSINDYYEVGYRGHSKSASNILEIFHALISNQNINDRKRLLLLNSTTKQLASASNLLSTEEFLYW